MIILFSVIGSNVTILASVQPLLLFFLSSDTKTFAYLNLTAEENDFKRCEYGSRTYKCSDAGRNRLNKIG